MGKKNIKIRANVPTGTDGLFSPGMEKFGSNLKEYAKEWGRRIASPWKAAARVGAGIRGKGDASVGDVQEAILGGLFAGSPGGGTGPANIMRKDLLKELAKQYRGYTAGRRLRRNLEKRGKPVLGHTMADNPMVREIEATMAPRFREVAKATHTTPQKELDRLDKVRIYAKPDYEDAQTSGMYNTKEKRIRMNVAATIDPSDVARTWFHETAHSRVGVPPNAFGTGKAKRGRIQQELKNTTRIEAESKGVPYYSKPEERLARKFGSLADTATYSRGGAKRHKLSDVEYDRLFNKAARITTTRSLMDDIGRTLENLSITKILDNKAKRALHSRVYRLQKRGISQNRKAFNTAIAIGKKETR